MKDLKEIPKRKYHGYVWMSDQEQPQVLNGKKEFNFPEIDTINPFVIEALLYCKTETDEIAVHVKHTGKYHIHEYYLNKLEDEKNELVHKEYIPHPLENVKKVCFKQLWVPEVDPLCNNMEVLTMKAQIFTGFKYQ